jgi:hypothetical protein
MRAPVLTEEVVGSSPTCGSIGREEKDEFDEYRILRSRPLER